MWCAVCGVYGCAGGRGGGAAGAVAARRAIGRLCIDRATRSKRPARTEQPPPTLISNHPALCDASASFPDAAGATETGLESTAGRNKDTRIDLCSN